MKLPSVLATDRGYPASQQIFEALRTEIKSGKYAPGSQLPATRELATRFRASAFTLHTALKSLTSEGWIERRPYVGTFIADPRRRFLCAGIYHAFDIASGRHTAFTRYLHFSLLEHFQRLQKDTQVFNDSRPPREQGSIFPPLADAIAKRRIQCLVALSINRVDAPALLKLNLPTAYLAEPHRPHGVSYSVEDFVEGSVLHLIEQGCRSIGIVSSLSGKEFDIYSIFRRVVKKYSLSASDSWIRRPGRCVPNVEQLGYEQFKALWLLPERPAGLVVYPDTVAHGVATAVLETGIAKVLPRMKFVFHRNAHLNFLCPFPVTWAISNEDKIAAALVDTILRQFAGEAVDEIRLKYHFHRGSSGISGADAK